jgi:transcription antitermination protein NusB
MSKDGKIGRRTVSRIVAAQTLFQYHFLEQISEINEILEDTIEFYIKEECNEKNDYKQIVDLDLTKTLVKGVEKNLFNLDKIIQSKLKKDNTLNGIQGVTKEILRLAIFELENMKETPTKIIINEYVNLTSYFGEKSNTTFANGILDNIAKEIRK